MTGILLFLSGVFAIALLQPLQAGSKPQLSDSEGVILGQVSGGNSSFSNCTVELIPLGRGRTQRTVPRQDGSFGFDDVTPGEHELRVRDESGRVLHHQVVSLRRDGDKPATRPGAEQSPQAQTVSVQRLQHKVPRKAAAEFGRGRAALDKQEFLSAVEHLKAAVALDPAFADAHNDLGFAYLRLKDYDRGAEQLQKAIDLDPGHQPANDNLCLLFFKMKRYVEARQAAERTLSRGTGSAVAHYIAAATLLLGGGSRSEALDHLRRAEDDLPTVRLLIARILANAGRPTEAAHELKAYLRFADRDSRRPELEAWLAQLRQ